MAAASWGWRSAVLAGAPLSGALHVQWGKQADQQCRANYALPETAGAEIAEIAAQCR